MNIQNINKLISVLEKGDLIYDDKPVFFDMTTWKEPLSSIGWSEDISDGLHSVADCNTTACLAGHIAIIAGFDSLYSKDTDFFPIELAQEWLGIDKRLASDLFGTSLSARNIHLNASRQDAIKVLKHLRETGQVEWGKTS